MVALVVTGGGLKARIVVGRSDGFRLDVDLTVDPGRTAALLGPNGAGKSTTVAAIAGLIAIDSGRIELGGDVVDDPEAGLFIPPRRRNLGVVFQDGILFPHLDVFDNICFGLRARRLADGEVEDRARVWMKRLELDSLARRKPGELSGGEAQRVALARALVTEPGMLLLDEPLAALDVTTRAVMRRVLGERLEVFPGPRLLITHDPTEAFLLADEIHVIENGRITQKGSGEDISLRPRTAYAADLAGANLLTGVAVGGRVDTGAHTLRVADAEATGPVLLTIHPAAVSVHRSRPAGSQRNAWLTTPGPIEPLGNRVRFRTGAPLPLTVEITRSACDDLELETGGEIWVAIKATEIGVDPGT